MSAFLKIVAAGTSAILICSSLLMAEELNAKSQIAAVIQAAGGEEKLLRLFRFRERVLITSQPVARPAEEEKENRTSVVQVSGDWWIGKQKRDKDKVRVLCWAWSLRILLDPTSTVEQIPETTVAAKTVFGLRVSGSVKEPIDLLFDKESLKLVAIDYTDTRHVFSDWKQTTEGQVYPSHVAGYRFTNRTARTVSETQWYQTDILELTSLTELPDELKPTK